MNLRKILLVALLLVAAVECGRLSAWQFGKLVARRAANTRLREARLAPLSEIAAMGKTNGDSLSGRRVHARGRYDLGRSLVLRARSWEGEPGVEVVTPLRLEGESAAVLVNRGWLPSSDGATVRVADFPESGLVEVRGLVEPGREFADRGVPSSGLAQGPTYTRLDLRSVRERTPYPLLGFSLRELPDSSWKGYPRRLELLDTGEGPHLSYGIQWIIFGLLCLGGALMILVAPPTRRHGD